MKNLLLVLVLLVACFTPNVEAVQPSCQDYHKALIFVQKEKDFLNKRILKSEDKDEILVLMFQLDNMDILERAIKNREKNLDCIRT